MEQISSKCLITTKEKREICVTELLVVSAVNHLGLAAATTLNKLLKELQRKIVAKDIKMIRRSQASFLNYSVRKLKETTHVQCSSMR